MIGLPARRRRMADAMSYLSINNIEVIYDHVILVLKGVSLQVPQGKIVALLGANGAGKSTTLKSISKPAAGRAGRRDQGGVEFKGTASTSSPGRPGANGRDPGDGRAPLFRPPVHRGEPASPAPTPAARARPN